MEQLCAQESSVGGRRLSSIEAVTPKFVEECRQLINKPMPPLPKDFLKVVK